jgi:hypothetical protein
MATPAVQDRIPEQGRPAQWTRPGSPLWGFTTGLLRALILAVIFYATIMYLIVMIGGYASLDDERLERSAEVAVNLAPFLVTGMALLGVAVFVSMRLAAVMSGIMLILGILTALLPGKDGASLLLALFSEDESVPADEFVSTFVDLVMLAGAPAVTLGLSLAVLRLNRTRWHDDRADAIPRALTWVALIGIGYGWFYAAAALSPFYLLVALASLGILRWWPRYAVWIATFTAIVGVTGLFSAMVQGPPERLLHRLPWAIAVLYMVPLARRGLRELDARAAPPSSLNDGLTPNPEGLPEATSAHGDPASTRDTGPAREGRHDASIPKATFGSGETGGTPPVAVEPPSGASQKQPAAPVRNDPPPPVEDPLRWFARPDRYRRPDDRPAEARVDEDQG